MRKALAGLLLLAAWPQGLEAAKHLTLRNSRTGVVHEIALVERRDSDAVSLAEFCRAVGLEYDHDRIVGKAILQKGPRLVQVAEGTPFLSLSGELRSCQVTPFVRGGALHVAVEDLPAVMAGLDLGDWDWSVRDRERHFEDLAVPVPPLADARRSAPDVTAPKAEGGTGPAVASPSPPVGAVPPPDVDTVGGARAAVVMPFPPPVAPPPLPDARTGPTPEARTEGLLRFVVLDAGHGGQDPGAIGLTGLREKIVVQKVARMVERKLRERLPHVEVYQTRKGGEFVGLRERVRLANRAVKERKAGVFVSIHANISRNKQTWGYETYYLSENASDDEARAVAALENGVLELEGKTDRSVVGRVLSSMLDAELIRQSRLLAECVTEGYGVHLPGVPSRGVKTARFFVLEGVMMPAVLTEIGFLSNREEERRLRDDAYLEKVADGIVEGIVRFSRMYDRYNGFT